MADTGINRSSDRDGSGRYDLSRSLVAGRRQRGKASTAFTLVEIMVVVMVIGLLAAIAIPNFIKARSTSQTNACISNLRQIDGAIHVWALEQKKDLAAKVAFSDISSYMKGAVICPSGGTTFANSYTIVDVSTKAVCQKQPGTHVMLTDTSN